MNLAHLHLGIFLSDDELLYAHMSHSIENEECPGMVRGAPQCLECFNKAVDNVRVRELAASLVMAQKLKALRSVGWSSFFYKDIAPKDGKWDDVKVEQSLSDDEDEGGGETIYGGRSLSGICEIEDDMRTTIWILRDNGRIRVRRTPWVIAST